MQLLDHVSITVRDLERAKPFYLAVMSALGATTAYARPGALGFGERNRPHDDVHTYLSVFESPAASPDPRRHWCFRAGSTSEVDAFHAAGMAAGGTSDGEPGPRDYHSEYYAAFLLDPEGNRVEAVFHHAGQVLCDMERFSISESYEAECRSSGDTRIGQIYHASKRSGRGVTLTPVARFFAYRPDYIENVNPHWRVDCFVRKHRLARDAERIGRDLVAALIGKGYCDEPLWLSWHRSKELEGAAYGEVFDLD